MSTRGTNWRRPPGRVHNHAAADPSSLALTSAMGVASILHELAGVLGPVVRGGLERGGDGSVLICLFGTGAYAQKHCNHRYRSDLDFRCACSTGGGIKVHPSADPERLFPFASRALDSDVHLLLSFFLRCADPRPRPPQGSTALVRFSRRHAPSSRLSLA